MRKEQAASWATFVPSKPLAILMRLMREQRKQEE